MSERTDELLWIGAFRYYCGRMTYAVGSFCAALCEAVPTLPERARIVIARDLDEAFARDDSARDRGAEYKPIGHDIDRAEWQKVREAFQRYNDGGEPHE